MRLKQLSRNLDKMRKSVEPIRLDPVYHPAKDAEMVRLVWEIAKQAHRKQRLTNFWPALQSRLEVRNLKIKAVLRKILNFL